eukprot:m.55153 g.55153  ORF g.55153 m.55153 type:complete len:672 (+) comp11947_c0_seq1:3330-5345(+)
MGRCQAQKALFVDFNEEDNSSKMAASKICLLVFLVTLGAMGQNLFEMEIKPIDLTNLPPHPRLVATDLTITRVRNSISSSASANRTYTLLLIEGNQILNEPPVTPPKASPEAGILTTARKIVGRLYTLGLLYRITGEMLWVTRAEQEMLAVLKFPSWNPAHFLDVAEITGAMAFGYDWMYNALSSSSRSAIAEGIYRLGLVEGLRAAYNGTTSDGWWFKSYVNWNQVCNSGLAIGALAIADDPRYTAASELVLRKALEGLPISVREYGPGGVWPEGVAYWGYALKYLSALLASLETVFGNDQGLALTGLPLAGRFIIDSLGPGNTYYNWADASDRQLFSYASLLMWLARRFSVPAYAYAARTIADQPPIGTDFWGSTAWHLLSFTSDGEYADLDKYALMQYDATRDLGFFRTAWTHFAPKPTPACAWVGFKGGNNSLNHNHLDHGSFVFWLDENQWVIDLGADNYSLPGYFGKQRFTYYRLNNFGHNTLTFDDKIQVTTAADHITSFNTSLSSTPFALLSLSAAYADAATAVRRGISLFIGATCDETGLVVADHIVNPKAKKVVWAMHTRATAALVDGGKSVILTSGSSSVQLGLSSGTAATCPQARFAFNDVSLDPPQYSTVGITHVTLTAATAACTEFAVLIGSPSFVAVTAPTVAPLDTWTVDGPQRE